MGTGTMKWVLFLPIFAISMANGEYTEEAPLKMLNVRSVASRYPASNSEHRTNLENGFDEEIERTESDILNGFPDKKLTLQPGGCAYYEFPIESGEINCFVQPARKQGEIYWDYCDKAEINVEVSSLDNSKTYAFNCFLDDPNVDPCSSKACHADISSIVAPDSEVTETINFKMCVPPESNRLGAVWEINFSTSNDSSRLEGFFVDAARERFRELQSVEEYNTQLSFVSIVGGRGVGKSTVASLLSGNASMFTTGSGSIGTTTTGADVSPMIPSMRWSQVLADQLSLAIAPPNTNWPMFFVDSEGMGIRGDAFDFITTSPPAVIAKDIIWIGAENVQTVKILEEIEAYLNGLDNIVMGDDTRFKEVFCESPKYGRLTIVINKMMGGASDSQLQSELMTPEPDYIPGSDKRNDIRTKINQCFDGIGVHGLPMLSIPDGEDVDYPYLSGRFKDGLASLASSIIQRLPAPRDVTVAGNSMELNATNVEVLIGTIIEEANNGKIDLNGFSSFWTFIRQEVNATLGGIQNELKPVAPACGGANRSPGGVQCTTCVCEYRNLIVDKAIGGVGETLEMAKLEAMNLFGTDLSPYIADFMTKIVLVWQEEHRCTPANRGKPTSNSYEQLCDLSATNLQTPGEPIHLTCGMMFVCGTLTADTTDLFVTTEKIYIGQGATIQNVPPPKAQNGADGVNPGDHGSDGAPGIPAFNMTLSANTLLRESGNKLIFISQGGAGGNGGNGKSGKSNLDKIPANPANGNEVYNRGPQVDYTRSCSKHCGGHCHCCDEYWYHALDITTDACGGNGGDGGNGGAGAPAGNLILTGGSNIEPVNTRLKSTGGSPGSGGVEASGLKCNRHFTGYRRYWESPGCHGFGGLSCGPSYHEAFGGYSYSNQDQECPGHPGVHGNPGINWEP